MDFICRSSHAAEGMLRVVDSFYLEQTPGKLEQSVLSVIGWQSFGWKRVLDRSFLRSQRYKVSWKFKPGTHIRCVKDPKV